MDFAAIWANRALAKQDVIRWQLFHLGSHFGAIIGFGCVNCFQVVNDAGVNTRMNHRWVLTAIGSSESLGKCTGLIIQIPVESFCEHQALGFFQTERMNVRQEDQQAGQVLTAFGNAELMLLDEPTQGMGHEDVDRVTQLIKKVSANRTILMVEHNMNVVASIADTISVLQRGQIIAEGPYETVSKNPQVLEAYMGTADNELEGAHG